VRTLTSGEVALGREVFEPGGAWERAQVLHTALPGRLGVVPFGRTIVFTARPAVADFSTAPLPLQGWFIHELTHVWQASRGVILPLAKLAALGRRAYRLDLTRLRRFGRYNIEQQAEIARRLFLARRGADLDRATLEAIWATR
jgi:hypothetical protein